jgi:hypothetical protein
MTTTAIFAAGFVLCIIAVMSPSRVVMRQPQAPESSAL